jgi:hypothetical protein
MVAVNAQQENIAMMKKYGEEMEWEETANDFEKNGLYQSVLWLLTYQFS